MAAGWLARQGTRTALALPAALALLFLTACATDISSTSSTSARREATLPVATTWPDVPEPLGEVGAPVVSPADTALLGGEPAREHERGQASWYGPRFHGRRTANGERYDMHSFTAAHPTLPFGTLVRVRSLVTGREVDVRINDRGPFSAGRIIDVSRAAADALGMLGLGVKDVLLLVPESTPQVTPPPPPPRKTIRAVRNKSGPRAP